MLIDTHVHLNDHRFDNDRQEVIERAINNGIHKLIEIGFDINSSEQAVNLADRYPEIYAAIGVHPHDAKTWGKGYEKKLVELAGNPKVIAIGEIGLDYHYNLSTQEKQKSVFLEQLCIAAELNLPVIIHDREAHDDIMKILDAGKTQKVLLHCFSGEQNMADWAISNDFLLAFGGSITFKNSNRDQILLNVPLENIVLETDCPYITPVPYRGKRNEPAYLRYSAQKIAELTHLTISEVANLTTQTANNFFNLSL